MTTGDLPFYLAVQMNTGYIRGEKDCICRGRNVVVQGHLF